MENLKDSIFKFLRLDNLMGNLTGYVETQVKLVKMEVRDEVAKILARGLVIGCVLSLALLFLVFVSIGLAHYLNSLFQQAYLGYWIVAGIYGLPCALFLLFRKALSHSFEKYFAKQIKHNVN
jgi:uncharacterized membrane protein YqjE